jgi:hypothetical protein
MRSKVEVASTHSSTYKEAWDLIIMPFYAPWQNYEKRLLALSCLSLCLTRPVCLSLRPYGATRLPMDGVL